MDAALPRTPADRSQDLADEITEVAACIYAATCRLLELIREFDEDRHWERLGMPSCAHWLNFKCSIGMNAAREKLRVAHALKDLPAISAAFRGGALSYSKVRAMTRVANADNEDYLMQIAKHGTAYHVERLVSTYRRCKRLEDSAIAERQHAARELSMNYDDDGSLVLKGRLPPEIGKMIAKAIERAVDDAEREAGDETAEDVSAETSETPPSPPAKMPIAARRADALQALAESYLNSGPRATCTADRYQVVVHVSAETLRSQDADDVAVETHPPSNADISQLEDGPGVSAETSRRLACDASLVGILDRDDGKPLDIGRKSRAVPPALRRALKARDKGCRFPGCTHRRWVDAHHIAHWADGGETKLENLVELCRHHHRLVHEGGFGCERDARGSLVFTDPHGRPLANCPEPVAPEIEPDLSAWLDAQLFEHGIDKDTCVTKWYAGDRMDWDLGVAHLFACEKAAPA